MIEVLKQYTFHSVIASSKMNIVRYRGYHILSNLFDILSTSTQENNYLPEDISELYFSFDCKDNLNKMRTISDYLSSMSDRYAIELYSAFNSDKSQTLSKSF